jgi:hypothetical protein
MKNTFNICKLAEIFYSFAAKYEQSYGELLLEKYNIKPIVTHRPIKTYNFDNKKYDFSGQYDETSKIGEGMFNLVHEVIYDGHLAVAKITNEYSDFANMKNLGELRANFGDLKKHLPIVYAAIKDEGNYITVVEKLNPVNSHILYALFNSYQPKGSKTNRLSFLRDSTTLNKLLDSVFNNKDDLQDFTIKKIKNAISIILRNEDYSKITDDNFHDYFNSLKNDIEIVIRHIMSSDPIAKIDDDYIDDFISAACNDLFDIIKQLYIPFDIFPHNKSEEKKDKGKHLAKMLPESKSLMKALMKLYHKHNITWDDLHSSNIMERPGTGDLVISDPGLFYHHR